MTDNSESSGTNNPGPDEAVAIPNPFTELVLRS